MALKTLMLKKKIDGKKEELAALRATQTEFETREAELAAAIEEAEKDEEVEAVEEEVDAFNEKKEKLEAEIKDLTAEIEELEAVLAELEKKSPDKNEDKNEEERSKKRMIPTADVNLRALPRNQRAFDALSMEKRRQIVEREDVRDFLARFRSMKGATRAITGAELNIPVVLVDVISENMYRYSKLVNRVRVRQITGEARQTIVGTVPEAVWTETCGNINELNFAFNQVTLDGYKVAGFIPVCNAALEDTSDVDLAGIVIEMISEAIGFAKDKAILYGTGSNMPMGIVTRLAQAEKPSDYPANAPEWVDLHTSNIISIDSSLTGADFWAKLMEAAGNAFTTYNRGEMFWAMNSKTYATLKSKVITFTATGDVVANVLDILPVVTGNIDILEFIPDGDIIGGYGDLYLWAQRRGLAIESSTEAQFIQDNTVFRGKERADGVPVIAGAFVAINIAGGAVTTSVTFAADTANAVSA